YLVKMESLDNLEISELMFPATQIIEFENDNMESTMKKFDSCNELFLPVLSGEGKFLGFASKTSLLNILRKSISKHQLNFN
ncbi:MAG TPA: hypothetical protein PKY12_14865, partial [Catalimonadaceae bacterium]|nr:hypothetical protein [Catalimonadaceae bacterium]